MIYHTKFIMDFYYIFCKKKKKNISNLQLTKIHYLNLKIHERLYIEKKRKFILCIYELRFQQFCRKN